MQGSNPDGPKNYVKNGSQTSGPEYLSFTMYYSIVLHFSKYNLGST